MLSTRWLAVAAALTVGAAALILFETRGPGAPSQAVELRESSGQAAPALRGPGTLPEETASKRTPQSPASLLGEPDQEIDAATADGTLRGILFDAEGSPLSNKTFSLVDHIDRSTRSFRSDTDEQGEFIVRSIPPGHYFARFAGEAHTRRTGAFTLVPAELEITPGDNGYVAFTLTGRRSFYGAFVDPDPGANGTAPEVYLHQVGVPDALLARLTPITNHEPDHQEPVALDSGDPGDQYSSEDRRPTNGGFFVEGLPATPIEVTIYRDGEHRIYMKETIDLTDGDLDWGRREISFRDFILWMRQHRAEVKPIGWWQDADKATLGRFHMYE